MTDVKERLMTPELIDEALTYNQYREMIDELMQQNKTTGENHSEKMLHYTKMNVYRMKRLDRTIDLNNDLINRLSRVRRKMIWLVITEAWCGDAAQTIPILQKMADQTSKIELKLILRDQHLEVMDQFLTDGRSRSIPKLICLDAETLEVVGDWGPRSEEARDMYNSMKNMEHLEYREIAEKLHKWYADDKTESIQQELLTLIDRWDNR